ncbi:MAG TPA: hypothetical protein VNQ90_17700 [Chthoniobacteraceae bacterium]|nr:hypothetical protein [Chthoniobacteraceae bacterium]
MNHLIPSFNAGELSPRLMSRPDLEKYGAGCRVLENFLIMPYGGVNRRPGTQFLGVTKFADRKARAVGFNFSVSTNFVLEFGHLYCRFWTNGAQVKTGGGAPLEIVTPYSEAEIFEFQFIQVNDVLFIVHPSHEPMTLSRHADDDWRLESPKWDWPPFLDGNVSDTTIAASDTEGTVILTASEAIFKAGHIGSYFLLTHEREATHQTLSLGSNGQTSAMRVIGKWDFSTKGTWSGTVYVERSMDDGASWTVIRVYESKRDRNMATNGEEEEETLIRMRFVFVSDPALPKPLDDPEDPLNPTPPTAYLEAYDTLHDGIVKVTQYISSSSVRGTVIKPLEATSATKNWAQGAWSLEQGFPRTVCLHEQRMIYGGTKAKPQTLWASAIGDFYTFELGSKDDDAFAFTLASAETNAIAWMVSQQALCIGTAGDEYILTSSSDGAITPTGFQVKRQSHFGSKYAPALVANDVALFIQRQGRKIREFVYEFQKDGYVAQDLTLLADHITGGGVVQTAFQQQPDAILWCVTKEGTLAGMTYERAQNVVGWHRHTTAGKIESVATIYSADAADEVWMIVERAGVRYVERLDPEYRESLESEDKGAWWYLDCASRFEFGAPTSEVSGLGRFEGREVEVLVDGAVEAAKVVDGGRIELERPARNVLVGLPYVSRLTPMPLDPGPMGDGTAQSRKFKVNRQVLRVYKSLGGEVEIKEGVWDPVFSRNTIDPMDASPPPFTGDKEVYVSRRYESTGTVGVRQRQPLPFTLLAMIPKYDVSGT